MCVLQGAEGVCEVLQVLREELRLAMMLTGTTCSMCSAVSSDPGHPLPQAAPHSPTLVQGLWSMSHTTAPPEPDCDCSMQCGIHHM